MRDAVIISGWTWEAHNVPERIALALSHLGARVLYCANPVSMARSERIYRTEVAEGVHSFRPRWVGTRLNYIPLVLGFQARLISNQILGQVEDLKLNRPILIYPHGDWILPVAREMGKRNFLLVHVCMDYPMEGQEKLVELSDITLVIPPSVYHQLKAKYSPKVQLISQSIPIPESILPGDCRLNGSSLLADIPKPRLGYLGSPGTRLNLAILREILLRHPSWHFLAFGTAEGFEMHNFHSIPWQEPSRLPALVAELDVGLMPYNCHDNRDFHCFPLKILDYFAAGLPVVSTPIINLLPYRELIYFGDTADELSRAITLALDEPLDDPRRKRRIETAKNHSIENLSNQLERILSLESQRSTGKPPEFDYVTQC